MIEGIDVVKVDCEGAEYSFLYGTELPERVIEVSVELHLTQKQFCVDLAPRLIRSFDGWRLVVKPDIEYRPGVRRWGTMGGWRRGVNR